MILVTLQHPSPYYDDSYGVNSANNGPYGDAIMQELIPAVETQFRVDPRAVGAPAHGRIDRRLDLARAPGLLSRLLRRHVVALSRTASTSAITRSSTSTRTRTRTGSTSGWMKVERPDTRRPDGNITSMMKDENWFELVAGRPLALGRPVGHLGGDLRPGRPRRLPERIWDKKTGVIDKQVADYWKAALRPAQHPRDQLGHARPEGREQDQRLRRRRGHATT